MAYLKDISAVLGLSISTVSRALKGYPDISEETRRKVKEAARELDYKHNCKNVPKAAARVWGTLGILAPRYAELVKSSYYRELFFGMAQEAAGSYRDLVIMGANAYGTDVSWVGRTRARRADGICLLVSRSDIYKGRFADLLESEVPVVIVGNDLAGHTSVCRDFRTDARAMLKYLKEKGHRKTAYFGDLSLDSRRYASIIREEAQKLDMGFLETNSRPQAENGDFIAAGEGGAVCALFSSHREARLKIEEWRRRGIEIPEKVSVAVIGGRYEENCADGITAIDCSPADLGKEAIRKLIQILEHPETDTGERIAVCGRIREGTTVREIGGNSTRNIYVNTENRTKMHA